MNAQCVTIEGRNCVPPAGGGGATSRSPSDAVEGERHALGAERRSAPAEGLRTRRLPFRSAPPTKRSENIGRKRPIRR